MPPPLHILHVIDSLGLGGAERMLVDIANRTAADQHRVSVCVTRTKSTLSCELDPRVEVLVLRRQRRFDLAAMLRLARFVRARKVDVIHAHLRSSLSFILALRVVGLIRTPIVFHDHYGTIEIDASTPHWFRIGHRFVAQYVGVYEKLSLWAQRAGMPANRTVTIPNALDLDRLSAAAPTNARAELDLPAETPVAIMVATLRKDKGVEILLEALQQSRHRGHVSVLVVGDDGEPDYAVRCRKQCTELGLDDTVTFVGPRTDVPGLLLAADLALLSSHTESGPLVLIEYLAAGLPIVSTHVGDIGHRLAASKVPGFVRAGDTVAFAKELDALLDLAPAERTSRGRFGRRVLDETWDIRRAMPRWYEVYRAAIASSP